MIVTEGGRFGGYGLFLSKGVRNSQGHVMFLYNLLDLKRTVWEGPELSPARISFIRFQIRRSRFRQRRTGCSTWTARKWPRIPWTTRHPIMFPEDETFDVGMDTRTGVRLRNIVTMSVQIHRQD